MRNKKQSKEIQAIEAALMAYITKHGGDCTINVSIHAFDEEGDVVDDQLWLYGDKDLLLIDNEEMKKEIENNIADSN